MTLTFTGPFGEDFHLFPKQETFITAHYTELAKVLDVISGIIGNVRAEGGNQLTPGGQQNQEAQGAAGFVGSGGSPSSDLGSLLGNIDSTFGGV